MYIYVSYSNAQLGYGTYKVSLTSDAYLFHTAIAGSYFNNILLHGREELGVLATFAQASSKIYRLTMKGGGG